MIDRSLNYGRHHIYRFLASAGICRTILDIGAGQGADLRIAREVAPDADLHAIEVYSPNVRHLADQGVAVHKIDIEKERFPFANSSVDVVIANQILEHTKELFWIFHEVSRVLRTGGALIVGVPNLASLHNRLLLLFGRQPTSLKNDSAHVRGYTRGDLLRFLDRPFPGGYHLVGFGGSNFYPFPPVVARPLAAAFPSVAWGIFLMLRKQRDYGTQFLDFPAQQQLETNFFVG